MISRHHKVMAVSSDMRIGELPLWKIALRPSCFLGGISLWTRFGLPECDYEYMLMQQMLSRLCG